MKAFDSETYLIEPGQQAPRLVCVSTAIRDSGPHPFEIEDGGIYGRLYGREGIEEFYEDGPQVYHNLGFDLPVFAVAGVPLEDIFSKLDRNEITDTMLREKLLDIAEGVYNGYINVGDRLVKRTYSLAALTRKYVGGKELDKDTWRLRYAELDGIPLERWPHDAKHYATTDAISTLQVWEGQEERRERLRERLGGDPLADEYRQARRLFALSLMRIWGIVTDAQKTDRLEEFTLSVYQDLVETLQEVGLVRSDGSRDTKTARAWMIDACQEAGIPVPITATGQKKRKEAEKHKEPFDWTKYVSLDKDACEQSQDEALIAYANLTTQRNILSKDVEALRLGHTQPIHTRINSILETGRPSSSGPNIFNIRTKDVDRNGKPIPSIRECFVPREGFWYLQSDYSGLELATLSQACIKLVGFSRLGETINRYGSAGKAHDEFALRGLGVTPESPGWYEARQTAKVANFGFPGGLGIKSLIYFARSKYGVKLDGKSAKDLKQTWLRMWPEMREYFRIIGDRCEESGHTTIRQLFSDRYRGRCVYTQACNSYFQGLGADATGLALYELQRECYAVPSSPMFGLRLVNYIYDEFIFEVPQDIDRANEAALRLVEVGEREANRFLPDVPVKMGTPVLMKYWTKKAEPVFDSQGRLVPWEV